MNNIEVVFVDDEEQNLFVYRKSLKKYFDVKTFQDPVEAQKYLFKKNNKSLVVVTDQSMPILTGEELARSLALEKEYLNFIMITGNLENDDNLSSRILSKKFFFDYIEKPIIWFEHTNSIINTIKTAASYSWRNLLTMHRATALDLFCENPYEISEYVSLNNLTREVKLEKSNLRMYMIFDTFILCDKIEEIAYIKKTKGDSTTHELHTISDDKKIICTTLDEAFEKFKLFFLN